MELYVVVLINIGGGFGNDCVDNEILIGLLFILDMLVWFFFV